MGDVLITKSNVYCDRCNSILIGVCPIQVEEKTEGKMKILEQLDPCENCGEQQLYLWEMDNEHREMLQKDVEMTQFEFLAGTGRW